MNEVKAPCGCPGEAIIGTYVRCLKGCDGGPVLMNARRTPGHTEMCACRPCQIRRRVRTIVLRSKDGRDVATLAWDGSTNTVRGYASKYEAVRHWKMLDVESEVVASGMVEWSLTGGGYALNIDLLFEQGVKLTMTPEGRFVVPTSGACHAAEDAFFARQLEIVRTEFSTAIFSALTSAPKIWPLLGREFFRQNSVGTAYCLERAALGVEGVADVRVTTLPDFTVSVAVRAYGSLAFEDVQREVAAVCKEAAPAGIAIQVVDETSKGYKSLRKYMK